MTKDELRKLYVSKRQALPLNEIIALNRHITENVLQLMDGRPVRLVHTYLPMEGKREPDTWSLVEAVKKRGIRIVAPRVAGNELVQYPLGDRLSLTKSSWGIEEPAVGDPVNEKVIDVVIVPLVVCDRQGHRVGYGKGFYDRFLVKCRIDCLKIGLSFFEPVEKIDDIHEGDVKLTHCCTPLGTIAF